jgi:hypothetical protein
MDTIFTVRNEELHRLSPEEAVDFFRELLWAEATSIGIGKNLINVPSAITTPDGGIDAEVQSIRISGGQGIIKQGLTRYQIKTGSFSPSSEADIKSILFKEGTKELKPRVKSCLDRDGTLVVVLFGWDDPERVDEQYINKFKEELIATDGKYGNSKIEIWGRNKLRSFLTPFPSLALALKGLGGFQFQTHKSWSQNGDMREDFVKSSDYQQKEKAIQEILRSSDQARHIRVINDAGGGKTRFILEATKAKDLASLVLYTKASKFVNSDLLSFILREDNRFNVIIVADECNTQHRIEIWNQLANRGSRIKLITIYNEPDIKEHRIDYCDIPTLSGDDIKQIILSYGIPKDHIDRWAGFAGKSPRFAHMIGKNLRYYPDDVSRPVEGIYDRIIAGYEDPNSEEVKKRKRVLMHIALFKRFGYRKPMEEEAKAVWKLVEKVDKDITWGRFQEIINKLMSLNILQGETTLYITPSLLHIRMWIEWWDTYGGSFDHDDFMADIPENSYLRKWFYEMLKYAAESGTASRVVKDLLGPTGPFKNFEYLETKLGGDFFLALTEADPESALNCLKRTIPRKTKDELLVFTTGRREVVWALERIAIWRDLFADAARILLALGEAENESYSNNASGVFVELFSPAYGKAAPTEAPPSERMPLLKEALESTSKEKRKLALRAFDEALTTLPSPRLVGAEYQGLRREPNLWMPKTYVELFDAYRQAWQLLVQELESMKEDDRQEGAKILLNNSRGLFSIGNLSEMVLNTWGELLKKSYAEKKEILSTVVQILHYDGKGFDEGRRKGLEAFRDELIGSGFSALLRRYAGMDLLEDQFDEEGKHIDKVQPKIEELAEQTIKDNSLLKSELPWLVTAEAQNGYRFGYELGKRDAGFKLLDLLIKAQREASGNVSVYFLGGYLQALFEKDQNRWEEQLDAIAKDEKLNPWLPELTWRSGMTDRAALRLLDLAQKDIISFEHFSMFGVGGVLKNISEEVYQRLCTFLLEQEKYTAINIALGLHFFYYIHKSPKSPLPRELTLRLLTHKSLFQKPETGRRGQMDDYHWTELGRAFVQAYPEKALELADIILEHFNEDGTILEGFFSPTRSVLDEITKKCPAEVWQKIKKYLGPPIDTRAFSIREWLKGGDLFDLKESALPFIPLEKIWEWVDEDVEERASYLASFVPKTLFREEGKTCLAREVLIRYGVRDDVRSSLRANFSTEGWSGPASLHYQEKKDWLLAFKKDEDNENVKRWIDEYVSVLSREVEQARVEEERRF